MAGEKSSATGKRRLKASDFLGSGSSDSSDVSDREGMNKLHGLGSGSESDDEDLFSSEEEDHGRTTAVKKRRKLENEDDEDQDEEDGHTSVASGVSEATKDSERYHDDDDIEDGQGSKNKRKNHMVKSITPEQLELDIKRLKKSGVVYISRIPPYMKPVKMRQILSRFGDVNRLFLTPEDAKTQARRKKYGGNKKKNYTEGWAEFVRKKDAKLAASTLNGNTIGGKKGSYYHDDILSVKYLPKFKWDNLTEQIALEAQARKEKLRAEISQATRENKMFIENVERKKMIDNIQKKKAESGKHVEEDAIRREFVQRATSTTRTKSKQKGSKTVDPRSEKVSHMLSKVL